MKLIVGTSLAIGIAVAATAAGTAAATTPCTVADLQQRAPKGTTIKAAAIVDAKGNVPQH